MAKNGLNTNISMMKNLKRIFDYGSCNVLYTKKIVGKKRKGKANVNRSIKRVERKYKLR